MRNNLAKIGLSQAVLLLVAGGLATRSAHAQGFGHIKKKVTLERKLPSVARLPGNKISVKASSENSKNADVARVLRDTLETELLKDDRQLSVDDTRPEVVINCNITNVSTPQPQTVTRKVASEKGLVDQQFLEVSGSLRVAYQAKNTRSSQVVDSYNIAETYQHEVEGQGGGNVGTKTYHDLKSQFGKIKPGKKANNAGQDPDLLTSPAQVQQLILQEAVKDIASRLVDTSETLEVQLARGKLDSANRLAEQGLWSRMAETLETTTPFPKPEDDAYRLYNLGVAYEAMAYGAKDPKAAKNFMEQAAINYGKAVDDNKSEKYFLEPQTRIETAAAHYKLIEERASAPIAAPAPAQSAGSSSAAASSTTASTSRGAGAQSTSRSHAASSTAGHSSIRNTASKAPAASSASAPGSKPLTNQDLIDLAKAGMDEDNLIANIREARSVNFDLSTQAQIDLVHNGIKGKVLTAMRERAKRSTH